MCNGGKTKNAEVVFFRYVYVAEGVHNGSFIEVCWNLKCKTRFERYASGYDKLLCCRKHCFL